MAGERKPRCPSCGGRLQKALSFGRDRFIWSCGDCKADGISDRPAPTLKSGEARP